MSGNARISQQYGKSTLLCFFNADPTIVVSRLFKADIWSSLRASLQTSCFSGTMCLTVVDPLTGGCISFVVSSLFPSNSLLTKPCTSQTMPLSLCDSAASALSTPSTKLSQPTSAALDCALTVCSAGNPQVICHCFQVTVIDSLAQHENLTLRKQFLMQCTVTSIQGAC